MRKVIRFLFLVSIVIGSLAMLAVPMFGSVAALIAIGSLALAAVILATQLMDREVREDA